jgi:CDP-4-dehydro-6-deoxyglucose reductase
MARGAWATTARKAAATAIATCAALLVEGRVEQAGKVRDHGEFYTCIAEPLEDCVVLWDGVLALGELPVRSLSCQVSECRRRRRYLARAPAGPGRQAAALPRRAVPDDRAGQRRKVGVFLASAPHGGRDLEMHVLAREASARNLIEQLQRNRWRASSCRSATRTWPSCRTGRWC